MERLIHSNELPGGNSSREFEGKEYGAGLTLILVDVEIFVVHAGTGRFVVNDAVVQASAGDIVVAPAGTAHRFINSGSDRLQLTAIHHNANFVTEWLESLTPDQRYWSSERR